MRHSQLIQRQNLRLDDFPGIRFDILLFLRAERLAKSGRAAQFGQLPQEDGGIVDGIEKAVYAVMNEIAVAADPGCDDGQAGCHRFHDRNRKAFLIGGKTNTSMPYISFLASFRKPRR